MTRTHKPKHTFLLRQAVTARQDHQVVVPLHQMQDPDGVTQVNQRGIEGWREKDKEGRIGMGYTTHDKHIHPHYCNNPPATHQCSLSLSPISVSHHRSSPSHTHTHAYCRQYISNRCISPQKTLNSSFIHCPSSAIHADKLSNLKRAEQNHFLVQYFLARRASTLTLLLDYE